MAEDCCEIYLVDFENVVTRGLNSLVEAKKEKRAKLVALFCSKHCQEIDDGTRNALREWADDVKIIEVEVGKKNALDFQLSSYLGYLVGKQEGGKNARYFVVSNDKGFKYVVSFFNQKCATKVSRLGVTTKESNKTKSETTNAKKTKSKKAKNTRCAFTKDAISCALSSKNKLYVADVLCILNSCNTKMEVNIKLQKRFRDNKKASSLYQQLKPLLADFG